MAVASAGPYANICTSLQTSVPHHSVFTGRMPFLPPNQQHQSTEGTSTEGKKHTQNAKPKQNTQAYMNMQIQELLTYPQLSYTTKHIPVPS